MVAMVAPLGAGNITASIISSLAAIVSLGLRLRARHSAAESWFIDDYMIVAALVRLEVSTYLVFSELTFQVIPDQLCGHQYLR